MSKGDFTQQIEFSDNHLLSELVGPQDKHILRIEQRLGISIALRGNHVAITGTEPEVSYASKALLYLYQKLQKQQMVDIAEVDSAIHHASHTYMSDDATFKPEKNGTETSTESNAGLHGEVSIQTKRRIIFPRTQRQSQYIQAMQKFDMVFGIGPAGTGKTYLAVAAGVSLLLSGKVDKIILSRPAVEAGEHLGFLPGDMREKVDPYLRPLYDALNDMLPPEQVVKMIASGEIEIAPLAFMRGRTLANAFVILDEAQNTTPMQMKMFLTRLGSNARMVINGDLTQIDLPRGTTSGLQEAMRILNGIDDIDFTLFTDEDVVRHPLVSKIVKAYDRDSNING
ncbi:MAG: PhoH family protein [Pseudomonadota bacterium]